MTSSAITLPEGPLLYIGIGILLVIHVIDVLIRWYASIIKKDRRHSDENIIRLLDEVHRIINLVEHDKTSTIKAHEQIDDLFKWHAPNQYGQQTWKTNHIELVRLETTIKDLTIECREAFKGLFKLLRECIREKS